MNIAVGTTKQPQWVRIPARDDQKGNKFLVLPIWCIKGITESEQWFEVHYCLIGERSLEKWLAPLASLDPLLEAIGCCYAPDGVPAAEAPTVDEKTDEAEG